MHATRNPDGSFMHRGIQYRLVERETGLFDSVDAQDGTVAGRLRVQPGSDAAPAVEPLPGALRAEAVAAVSRLLSAPLGAMPLQ